MKSTSAVAVSSQAVWPSLAMGALSAIAGTASIANRHTKPLRSPIRPPTIALDTCIFPDPARRERLLRRTENRQQSARYAQLQGITRARRRARAPELVPDR